MFGMQQAKQIVVGHINESLKLEEKLYAERKPICDKCKLKTISTILGIKTEICNPDLYLNPKTNETSKYYKEGYYSGCGCRLEASTRVKDKECPAGKW